MTQRAIDGPYVYLVTAKTANNQPWFDRPDRARRLGNIIQKACHTYGFVLFVYCVLPDHLHLIVQKRDKYSLSVLMKSIKGGYSFSLRQGRFWQSRSNFRIIDNEKYFDAAYRYVIHNSQKHGLARYFEKAPFVYIDHSAIASLFQ